MGVESKLNAENGIADPYPIPVKSYVITFPEQLLLSKINANL